MMDNFSMALAILPVIAATGAWVRRVEVQIAEQKTKAEGDQKRHEDLVRRFDRFEDKLDRIVENGQHRRQ